ncbi:DUF6464 family protein [Synechococcus sp. Nb3U1]|uniref:DUF6464 family protein n=1 Tax=Synechococcus sp. Nb3U1 TaxID=1914529 RepID=UPI001F192528|nr:DUF6464 family protein [Synechococcus sp. Nb3U1]MCF2970077.1 DUF6464 family protein [Synechococcus sp. Nb3U1]
MVQLMVGVGLWLGLTFLAQLIPLLDKIGSHRAARRSWDLHNPHRLLPSSQWDSSCQYFSRSMYLPCAVNPLGPCRCSHYVALPKDSTSQAPYPEQEQQRVIQ